MVSLCLIANLTKCFYNYVKLCKLDAVGLVKTADIEVNSSGVGNLYKAKAIGELLFATGEHVCVLQLQTMIEKLSSF